MADYFAIRGTIECCGSHRRAISSLSPSFCHFFHHFCHFVYHFPHHFVTFSIIFVTLSITSSIILSLFSIIFSSQDLHLPVIAFGTQPATQLSLDYPMHECAPYDRFSMKNHHFPGEILHHLCILIENSKSFWHLYCNSQSLLLATARKR